MKKIYLLCTPSFKKVFNSIETIHKNYQFLKELNILLNGKNLPVQLGEWFAKCIFGLKQIKSTSQRGFDLYLNDGSRVEIKVHWSDQSSPKGVKLKKAMLNLSKHCIIIYLADNFMIREICFLDSDYIMRKFAGKGHTIFLKDQDVSNYFFSKSEKHFVKIVNKMALMKFSNPTFAMRLDGRI